MSSTDTHTHNKTIQESLKHFLSNTSWCFVYCIGSECAIRRSPVVIPASPPIYAYWTWDEGHTNFAVYSIEAILYIEQAYMQGSAIVDLSQCPCGLPYTVDFSAMTQIRHGYMTERVVMREPLNHGQSLQSLLAPVAPVASTSGIFSLATGPATNILNSAVAFASAAASSVMTRAAYSQPSTYIQPTTHVPYTGSGPSSTASYTGGTVSSSTKSSSSTSTSGKRRRGKKGSATSSSPPLTRGAKTEAGG